MTAMVIPATKMPAFATVERSEVCSKTRYEDIRIDFYMVGNLPGGMRAQWEFAWIPRVASHGR